MSQTLKFGSGTWATKKGSTLAYSDTNNSFKPLPFTYTGAGKGTRVNKEGLIEVVENDRPRIDYLDSEDGVFLLEKAATNLITYSEDFSQWINYSQGTGSLATLTSNYSISPDGTKNASRIQCVLNGGNTSSDRSYIKLSGFSGTPFTCAKSLYVKNNLNVEQTFFIGVNAASDRVTLPVSNKWQRLKVEGGVLNAEFRIGITGNSLHSDSIDIDIFAAQLESGSYASSYIPTQGTIQTRVQETASGSGNSEVFNSEQGVLFANIAANANDGTTRLISLSNGSDDNRLNFYYRSTANQILVKSEINNGTPTDIVVDVNNATLFSKFSIKYNSSELKVFNNGFEVGSVSGNFSYPLNSLNVLNFDNTIASGSNNFNGKTKEIAYYDEVLTDLELETLTSYRTWLEMVKELNLNIIHNE
jgi:hypothetical protein